MKTLIFQASVLVMIGSAVTAGDLGWLDQEALGLGRVIFGFAFLFVWFWAGKKAAESGNAWLAWVIGLGPFVVFVLGLAGAFR